MASQKKEKKRADKIVNERAKPQLDGTPKVDNALSDDNASSNASLVVKADESVVGIKNIFQAAGVDIENMTPLGVSTGGSGHPFTVKDCKAFFSNKENRGPKKFYEAKINVLWVANRSAGMTGVPWRAKAIEDMSRDDFEDNRYTQIMNINIGLDPTKVEMPRVGGLMRVSPPELHLAFVDRMHCRLKESGEDPEVCESVKVGILDVTARFYSLTEDQAWWFEYNNRDQIEHLSKKVGQTVYQRICGLVSVKNMRIQEGGQGAAEADNLAAYMQSKAEFVGKEIDQDEATSAYFITTATKVIEAMEEHSIIKRCLSIMDQEKGSASPLNSIHKIAHCIRACEQTGGAMDSEALTWLFETILDGTRANIRALMEAPLSLFKGGNKGGQLASIIIKKRDFKHCLFSKIALMFTHDFTSTLRDVFHNHESYREKWKDLNEQMRPSKYLATWTAAERMVADFIATACFSFDESCHKAYRTNIARRSTSDELIDHSIFQDTWTNIVALQKEQKNKEAAEQETQRKKEVAMDEANRKQREEEEKEKAGKEGDKAPGMDQDDVTEDEATRWKNYADQTVSSIINFHPNPVIQSVLIQKLKEIKIMQVRPRAGNSTVVIYYDEKKASECATSPWERRSPARPTYLELVPTIIREFGIPIGFLYVYADAGKTNGTAAFKKMVNEAAGENVNVSHMTYDVWYDEESWRERCRTKKCTRIEPRENLHVSYVGNSLPVNKRTYYQGTNHGRLWSSLVLDSHAASVQVPHGQKKKYYGDKAMRPGGGPPDADPMDAGDGTTGTKISGDTVVPFCWRTFPLRFDRCFVQTFKATHILDLTPGNGNLPLALMMEGEQGVERDYHGFCHTPEHQELLRKHLLDKALALMQDETSKLYTPSFAKYMKGQKETPAQKDEEEDKPKRKKRTKAAEKLKSQKRKRVSKDDAASDGIEDVATDAEDDLDSANADSSPPLSDEHDP